MLNLWWRLFKMVSSKMTVEQLVKSRLKNDQMILKASSRIDAFRKKYGQPQTGFHSLKILRKLRETR